MGVLTLRESRFSGHTTLLLLCLLVFACSSISIETRAASGALEASGQKDVWTEAAKKIVRLPPAAFPELPEVIREELERIGATIPQVDLIERRHNVVKGHFRTTQQMDWAVLCSIGGISSILIFWNGTTEDCDTIELGRDSSQMQGMGLVGLEYMYSVSISTAEAAEVKTRYIDTGEIPDFSAHEGITIWWFEKGADVEYLFEGTWLTLGYSD